MDEQLVADLRGTRKELQTRGRCTGELMRPNGKVCLDGAILAAVLPNEWDWAYDELSDNPRARAVCKALYQHLPESYKFSPEELDRTERWQERTERWNPEDWMFEPVYDFNDDRETTDQDCFDLIDKAIAEAGGMGD